MIVLLSVAAAAACGGLIFLGFVMGCMLTHRDYEGARSGLDWHGRQSDARPGGRELQNLADFVGVEIDVDAIERERAAAGRRV